VTRVAGQVRFAVLLAVVCLAGSVVQAQAQDREVRVSARKPPAWVDTAVIYEIYPRDFSAEGTLNGVTAKLDQLHELGVNVLWIMPVNPIGELKRLGPLGSPYSPRDYYAIDPGLGTKEDFANLVRSAHERGMRVILDMVADHTSWDSVMMAHPEFYTHDRAGRIVSPHGWSDVAGLNYDNPALRRYMMDVFVYWLKTFQLDGFRCDAAAMVPTSFWEELRPALDAVKPDVLMLAEASRHELMTKAFDLDYAWPMLATFNEVLESGSPANSVQATWKQQTRLFPEGAEHMLISDDHDERRAIVRYGERGTLAASALVFTLPGVPMLYNGMEVGDATPSGAPALFSKRTIDWSAAQQERVYPSFYRALIELRTSSAALRHGSLQWLHNSDEEHVVSFERRSGDDTELVTVNLSNTPFHGSVEVESPLGKRWAEASLPQRANDRARGPEEPPPVALPALSLDAFQTRIFRLAPAKPGGGLE
jgi:cyclomaltodextrinase / maltogenic alpha-amylase / neopullulanase